MSELFIRTCQECGHKQVARHPKTYPNDIWRNIKCKNCHSNALDYGKYVNLDDLEIVWRWHDSNIRRIWRSDWFGDQFELVNQADFDKISWFCSKFNITLNEAED